MKLQEAPNALCSCVEIDAELNQSSIQRQEEVCDYVSEQVLPHAINGEHICGLARQALRFSASRR